MSGAYNKSLLPCLVYSHCHLFFFSLSLFLLFLVPAFLHSPLSSVSCVLLLFVVVSFLFSITLVDPPTEIEGSFSNLKNLSQAEVLHRLALDANNLASQGLIQQASAPGSFSISDFLVPGLQTKTWEDWQVADELNPFA